MGQVPALVIEKETGEKLVLTQSLAIIEYLDEGLAKEIKSDFCKSALNPHAPISQKIADQC